MVKLLAKQKKKVVVAGAGGFGRETIDILVASQRATKQWKILGFVDDDPILQSEEYVGYRVLGPLSWLEEQKHPEEIAVVVAVGDNLLRRKLVRRIAEIGCSFATAIHPSAIMTESVSIGEGVIIAAGSVLTNRILVGNHAIINLNVTVGHDVILEDYVNLNPGVSINGSNIVGEGTYIGSGAVTIQQIRIGKWSIVGAGAVVIRDIPDYVLAVGVPARVKKELGKPDGI